MNIDNLTFGQLKQIASLFNSSEKEQKNEIDDFFLGKFVIIRTYSAGVWAGFLTKKTGNQIILSEARRMWQWKCLESISLSGCAKYGIDTKQSKIAPTLNYVWLEAIEILPTTEKAKKTIEEAKDAPQN